MGNLQVVRGMNRWSTKQQAILLPCLPEDEDTIRQLVAVLMRRNVLPEQVLQLVRSGTPAAKMGAKIRLCLAIEEVPADSQGFIFVAENWVITKLDPAMPKGWGAALVDPIQGRLRCGDKSYVTISISPMDRSKTRAVSAAIARPDHPQALRSRDYMQRPP